MRSPLVQHNCFIRFLLLFVLFSAMPLKIGAGQEQKEKRVREFVRFQCQGVTVKVDPQMGTNPKAVYLCAGETLTFDPNGHQFKAVFKKSPFKQTIFDNDHNKSGPAKKDLVLTVYQYTITVDGKLVHDPQVVTGGGN